MVDLSVLGISLQGEGSAPMLLLYPHGTEQILCLSIGPMEAFAISAVLNTPIEGVNSKPPSRMEFPGYVVQGSEGIKGNAKDAYFPRPMTHDLMHHFVKALGGKLLSVEIVRMLDDVFFAEAVLSKNGRIARVDCRPSDGIALALRCNARIKVAQTVLAYAEDGITVLQALPEHVRIIVQARLAVLAAETEDEDRSRDSTSSSLMLEAALAVRETFRNEGAQTAGANSGSGEGDEEKGFSFAKALRILESGKHEGGSKALGHVQGKIIGTREKRAVPGRRPHVFATEPVLPLLKKAGSTEEERWAALLHVLSPETKVLM